MKNQPQQSLILADAHVHIYSCFELSKLLDSAFNNFERVAAEIDNNSSYSAFLLLTETSKDNYFNYLTTLAKNNPQLSSELSIETTAENCSLVIRHRNNHLYLIAGRQIVTAENLEVLALANNCQIEDGKPIGVAIAETIDRGGIPVIPWGFGKWMGRRGAILEKLLESHDFPYLFLGDNSGRPNFWSNPQLFERASQWNLKILPGSDPLPFASEADRAGSFGFTVTGKIDAKTPARSIKQILLDSPLKLETYGALETPYRFIRNQIAMQIIKRQRLQK